MVPYRPVLTGLDHAGNMRSLVQRNTDLEIQMQRRRDHKTSDPRPIARGRDRIGYWSLRIG
jgi:hypothetical protein